MSLQVDRQPSVVNSTAEFHHEQDFAQNGRALLWLALLAHGWNLENSLVFLRRNSKNLNQTQPRM
jgi:hypothetical protein